MSNDKELGFDPSPPRNNVILAVGILSAVTLAALNPLLMGYFDHMVRAVPAERRAAEAEERRLNDKLSPLDALERAEREKLSGAPVSINAAMEQVSARGLSAAGATQPSDDVQAVLGWNQLPNEQAAAAATAAGQGALAPVVDADGGVAVEGADAGAPAAEPQTVEGAEAQ